MRATEILNIEYPIIQGPFGGGLSSISLLSCVSNAGGLGSFGAHYMEPVEIETLIQDIRLQTDKPFAVNLWVNDHDGDGLALSEESFQRAYQVLRPYFEELGLPEPEYPKQFGVRFDEQIEPILKMAPPVFSFVYGIPDETIIHDCKKRGIKTIGTATTLDEAIALDDANIDIIVATGFEAGGHRVSFINEAEDSLMGTMSLIPQIVDHVKAPVIAAGGIADKRGMNAAMALGAQGVQIGTAFLACTESNAPDIHREALWQKEARHTALTRVFTGRLARGINNRIIQESKEKAEDFAPYPAQSWFMKHIKTKSIENNQPDLISLWCGQSAPLLKHKSAYDLFQSLI